MKLTAIKTQNSNYLAELPSNHYYDYAFFDSNLNFLRLASKDEGGWLFYLAEQPKRKFVPAHYTKRRSKAIKRRGTFFVPAHWYENHNLDIVNINIQQRNIPGVYIIPEFDYEVFIQTIDEDFSNFSPERCNNGGDYGFWADQISIYYEGNIYTYIQHHTTAEFAYDEDNGYFDQKASATEVAIQKDNDIYIFENLYINSLRNIYMIDTPVECII